MSSHPLSGESRDSEEFDWSWVPQEGSFVAHWRENPPTASQREMLVAHFWSPELQMHPRFLARSMGWENQSSAHLHYGKFAGTTAQALGVQYPSGADKISIFAAFVRGEDREIRWEMHSSVRSAIVQMEWHRDGGPTISDAETQLVLLNEGRQSSRIVKVRERSASVRQHCLTYHQPICAVCKFDPLKQIGEEFVDLLEIHHLYPIAASTNERATDPVEDCRPLCPTCHRLAHMGMKAGTCRSIEDLKMLVGCPS